MKTTIIIPTYNEADNISLLIPQLLELPLVDVSILVVDDNSPDGTGKIAETFSVKTNGKVKVLHRPRKSGLGKSYIAGFSEAIADGADIIVQMDADFSHLPEYIPAMVQKLTHCDVVVGSRYVKGGRLDESWGWKRYFLSWFANSIYIRLLLGVNVKDGTAGFKAWKRETLLGVGLDRVRSDEYAFQVEMAYLTERLGYKVQELPIYFKERHIGLSKLSSHTMFEAAWRVFQIRGRYQKLSEADRLQVEDREK